jgi:hypothetical protein
LNDKHSLADDKTHSLSEKVSPLDEGMKTVGAYPNEDEQRERFSPKEKKQNEDDYDSWRGWQWIIVIWVILGLIAVISHFAC